MGIKLKQFIIVLDRPPVFRPGEVVSGHCIIQLDGEMHLNQLTIKLKGVAKCMWTETRSVSTTDDQGKSVKKEETHTIKSKHNCIELLYSPGSVYSNLMSSGQHNIGFNFQLPPSNLPSSFEGKFGHIRYTVKAKVDNKGIFTSDEKTKLPLTIQSPAFYSIQDLSQSVHNSSHKTVGLIGGKSVSINCQMPRKGYNIGTSIPITCLIDNKSKKSMTLRASLKQEITFTAEGQVKKSSEKVVVSVGSEVQAKSQQTEIVSLVVPSITPVSLSICPNITIRYLIKVTLVISGSFDLHCELPVILTNESLPLEFS